MENKKIGIIAAVIGGAVIIVGGLIFLAQGGTYPLTTVDPAKGAQNPKVVIEEFADFQCPACASNASIVAAVVEEYPEDVQLVYKDFPLPSHSKARPAAIAALCAAQQDAFFPYHDMLFAQQAAWSAPQADHNAYFTSFATELELNMEEWEQCRNSRDARREVDSDYAEGNQRQVNATPTFFIDGEKIDIPSSFFAWKQLIDEKLGGEPAEEESGS